MLYSAKIRFGLVAILAILILMSCSHGKNPVDPGVTNGQGLQTSPSTLAPIISAWPGPQSMRGQSAPRWLPDEVLVVLQSPISQTQAVSALQAYPLIVKRTDHLKWGTMYRLKITDGTPVPDMVNRLKSDPLVKIVEPNFIYPLCDVPYFPNDPKYVKEPDGKDPRVSPLDQWGPYFVGAPLVWNESIGHSEVVVAVLDTGVRRDHEDLGPQMWNNYDEIPDNGIDDDNNGYIDDTWGWNCRDWSNDPNDDGDFASYHGTACSGVIAAAQDNTVGVTGIAPGVKIMAILADMFYSGTYTSDVIEGLEYARVNNATIVSMSFGGYEYSDLMEQQCLANYNDGDGVILMAAAGNEDQTTCRYPGAFDCVITIGATCPFNGTDIAPMNEARIGANTGFYWGSCYGDKLDVMGYGSYYSTTHGSHYSAYWEGGSDGFGGTSCATPMSAGVMALIKSFYPEKNAKECWDRIKYTADDLDAVGFDNETGFGRCNAFRAIYGSDRYTDQEDANGFVELTMPDTWIYDSIQDVPDNPYYDKTDLYILTADKNGTLDLFLDIFTWGEDIDITAYSDPEMTLPLGSSTGPNTYENPYEEILINVVKDQQIYIKVESPASGNSTTYGLHAQNVTCEMTISGESISPPFIHQQGSDVPILKLTFETNVKLNLSKLILNMHGSLPNANFVDARIYRDTNSNGQFDQGDALLAEKLPNGLNRVVFDSLNVPFDYHKPMDLFFTADFSKTTVDSTVTFSLESYKDATTVQAITAAYDQFPIKSNDLLIGTDTGLPVWNSTVGAVAAKASYQSVFVTWNGATDALTPPVKYNIYYLDTLPFDIGTATKLADVTPASGDNTDYKYLVTGLSADKVINFVVRAEDQAGNEDKNLNVVSAQPSNEGDPTHPIELASYPLTSPQNVSISGTKLGVSETSDAKFFDLTDPIKPVQEGSFADPSISYLAVKGNYAYSLGTGTLSIIDIADLANPVLKGTCAVGYWGQVTVSHNWAYVSDYSTSSLIPVDVADPENPVLNTPVLGISGWTYDIMTTPNRIYVSSLEAIDVFDLVDPGVPAKTNSFASYGYTNGLAASSTALFGTYYYSGQILSYDIASDPDNPPNLDTQTGSGGFYAGQMALVGNYIYMVQYTGLDVFDVTNPSNMQFVGTLPLSGPTDVATDGKVVYVIGTDQTTYEGYLKVII